MRGFGKKMDELLAELAEQFKQSKELIESIKENLGDLGFDL